MPTLTPDASSACTRIAGLKFQRSRRANLRYLVASVEERRLGRRRRRASRRSRRGCGWIIRRCGRRLDGGEVGRCEVELRESACRSRASAGGGRESCYRPRIRSGLRPRIVDMALRHYRFFRSQRPIKGTLNAHNPSSSEISKRRRRERAIVSSCGGGWRDSRPKPAR
jgi:hypothetical protein